MKVSSRKWKVYNCEKHDFEFKVASYNVLSTSALNNNLYLYQNCEQDSLTPDLRFNLLISELELINADIYCLQEVDEKLFKEKLEPFFLSRNFRVSYYSSGSVNHFSCLIAYSSIFDLSCENRFKYLLNSHYVRKVPNDALILVLSLNKSFFQEKNLKYEPVKICIVNTHLLFGPSNLLVRLQQCSQLIECISNISREHDSLNIILCGDFNSHPFEPSINFILNRHIRATLYDLETSRHLSDYQFIVYYDENMVFTSYEQNIEIDQLPSHCHLLPLNSSYPHTELDEDEFSISRHFTSFVKGYEHSFVDYIFYGTYSVSSTNQKVHLLQILDLPTEPLHPIPSNCCSSDHLPLASLFGINFH